ncbi:MAG: hypothetical protein V9G29_15260 [Burkholderiaceae bacterium]
MRSYPRNSPEAAARIVALVLIADGHVCRSEFDALNHLDGAGQLGLEPDGMPLVIQSLCEDLLMGAYAGGSMMACVDDGVMASLMAEVDEPALQRKVLQPGGCCCECRPASRRRRGRGDCSGSPLLGPRRGSRHGEPHCCRHAGRLSDRASGARRGEDLQHQGVVLSAA